jgi:uncharacterized protein (DUF305 family)
MRLHPHGLSDTVQKRKGNPMSLTRAAALAGTMTFAFLATVHAQDMQGMDMSKPMGDQGASSKAYNDVMNKMHRDMMVTYSGNADADFVRGMIPHHQGAIDMAKVELRYGKDPEMRKLAEAIVIAQEKEITEMNAWLKKHGQ